MQKSSLWQVYTYLYIYILYVYVETSLKAKFSFTVCPAEMFGILHMYLDVHV